MSTTSVWVVYYDYDSDENYDKPECVFDSKAGAEKFIADANEPWASQSHWKMSELALNKYPDWMLNPVDPQSEER